jgi:catechol 2,3-dioxygenase-like lactoylglutathione lyase family enzyme
VTPPLVHLNLTVADVDRSVDFYRRWFGFTGPRRHYPDGTVFVSNDEGFDLALHPGRPPEDPAPTFHFGFRCPTPDEVRAVRADLGGAGVQLTESYDDDGYVNLKCRDPDGYEIEVYWEAESTTPR